MTLAIGLPAALESCSSNHDGVALGVTARERVALTATASKIVVAAPVREGRPVKEGDILVQLDDRIERADLALATAQLASAQASLAKLRAGARK
ncbi:efflux RND transporter periplasmic adaptor subunit [Jhaorihella thermophila]|uniref:biotin/lipoyl-binding protein n=1 Tax=Jhaorihella thermophila TaxID=488547 RepID=UPI001F22EDDA|nr:biotin/lipoyl-binding protein [Jhaorihella thermophila]